MTLVDILAPTKRYSVWVDVDRDDPTDPDLLSENVLHGEYDDRAAALKACQAVSLEGGGTLALLYDNTRPSQVTKGPLLLAGYENGRSF